MNKSLPPRTGFGVLLIAFVLVCFPGVSEACTDCSRSIAWVQFPPLVLWEKVILAWYFALVVISLIWNQKIRLVPSRRNPGTIAGIAVLYLMRSGPVLATVFLPLAIVSMVWELWKRPEGRPASMNRTIHAVGILAITTLLGSAAAEIFDPTPRTPADIVLRWEGTVSEQTAFGKMKKSEPQSASDYRRIVREGRWFAVGFAAARLALIGESEVDVPLMIDALDRVREADREYVPSHVEEALRKMTGIKLPEDTSAEDWRAAWSAKLAEK